MACLNPQIGPFNSLAWSTVPSFSSGGTTVTRSATSILVQRAGQAAFNDTGNYRYAVFGDLGFAALLKVIPGAGTNTWYVALVDITGPSLTLANQFNIELASAHAPPALAISAGNGRMVFFSSGTDMPNEAARLMIARSDNGKLLLTITGTIAGITGPIFAEATATDLVIHHPTGGVGTGQTSGPLPVGILTISPKPLAFGEAVLNGSNPAQAKITKTFTLKNSGADCTVISAIADNPPYAVTPLGRALLALPRTLEPGASVTVDVEFAPAAAGSPINRLLAITRAPANGDSALDCRGSARNAVAAITLTPAALNFGTLPHPGSATRTFAIRNTGDFDLTVNIPAPTAGSAFTWSPFSSAAIAVGAHVDVNVTFNTPGDFAATPVSLTITASNGAASKTIQLTGAGCIANAVAAVPPAAPIVFGEIEAGFRTARLLKVGNTGDGDLTFEARIAPGVTPGQAALFGLVLPNQDITDAHPSRAYTVLPPARCGMGPTGPGEVAVAISFYADAPPSPTPYTAVLEIDIPGVGVTAYPLSAMIIPAVPVDAILVIDTSDSMTGSAGQRTKIEAAKAAGSLFGRLLREQAEDRAGIVTFGDNPAVIFPIAPVAGNASALAGSFGFGTSGFTNIAGGVITASEMLVNNPHPANAPGLKRAIIVLTDGIENRCFQMGGAGPWYSISGRDAGDNMYRPGGGTAQDTDPMPAPPFKVYAVGLGNPNLVDGAVLDQLATATGADFDQVVDLTGNDFFLLEKYYTQIFMETAGLAILSDPFYVISPGDTHPHEFDVFPGDVNAMVVIYDHPLGRLPFFLVSPAGEKLSGASLPPGFGVRYRSTSTARFVEVAFPRGEPKRYAGRWRAVVTHPGRVCHGDINPGGHEKDNARDVGDGFLPGKCGQSSAGIPYGIAIGAGSNLRMQPFVEPGVKLAGAPLRLNALVAEAGLPVLDSKVTVLVTTPSGAQHLLTLSDDGAHLDGAADDGDYGGLFTNTAQAGVYSFVFRATGFQAGHPYAREAHRTKTFYDRRRPPHEADPCGSRTDHRRLIAVLARLDQKLGGSGPKPPAPTRPRKRAKPNA